MRRYWTAVLLTLLFSLPTLADDEFFGPHRFFVPSSWSTPRSVVVVLHGCNQSARDIARIGEWDEYAEKNGFAVLYPSQKNSRNGAGCWNWFYAINQQVGLGEPGEIVRALEYFTEGLGIERRYVAGLSAGAATVSTLLACYPKLFQAGLIHSGVAYAMAKTAATASQIMTYGPVGTQYRRLFCNPRRFRGGLFVVHGGRDKLVHPGNRFQVIRDFLAGTETVKFAPPSFDYETTDYYRNNTLIGRQYFIPWMTHAWSGGISGYHYSEPNGPKVTEHAWEFFQRFD